jgi:hypothetical protein
LGSSLKSRVGARELDAFLGSQCHAVLSLEYARVDFDLCVQSGLADELRFFADRCGGNIHRRYRRINSVIGSWNGANGLANSSTLRFIANGSPR